MDPGDGKMHKKSIEAFTKQWTGVLVLLLPNEDFEVRNEKTSVIRRFWTLLRPHTTVMPQRVLGA